MSNVIDAKTDLRSSHGWVKFIIGLALTFFFMTRVFLPIIGSYGHKPAPVVDPYVVAILAGHLEEVVYDAKVTEVKKVAGGGLSFTMTFTKPKLKEYCTFSDVVASIGATPLHVITRAEFVDKTTKAGGSTYTLHGWIIKPFTNDFIELNSMAGIRVVAQHRCHPDFITTTELYPNSITKQGFELMISNRLEAIRLRKQLEAATE